MSIRHTICGALLAAITATSAAAQSPGCSPRDLQVAYLETKFGETRGSIGIVDQQHVFEVFRNSETGSWTATVTNTQGFMCLIATGSSYMSLDEAPVGGGTNG